MCSSTFNSVPHARHGEARWVSSNPAELLRTGQVAYLRIGVTGQEWEFYGVRQHQDERGLVSHYTLEPLGLLDGAIYTVDVSFGPLVQHWSCDCREAQNRYRGRNGCRHVGALYAALLSLSPRGIALAA